MSRRPARAAQERAPRRVLLVLLGALVVGGCTAVPVVTPVPSAASQPGAIPTLSPEAAAIPRLLVEFDGRQLMLAGYDPSWPSERAADRDAILRLAPHLRVERGRTYPLTMRYQAVDPVIGWLPPDFGHVGGSEPVRTSDGFVLDRPSSAFVRSDALPDLEAGLFGVKVDAGGATRLYAYPVWIEEADVLEADAFTGLRVGISDEDGGAAASAFIDHVSQDLARGGGPAPVMYASKAELVEAFEAGDLDAYMSIPAGWSANPTTRNGFEHGSADPVNGNGATDTGDSYRVASLIIRALGPAGLILDRGY